MGAGWDSRALGGGFFKAGCRVAGTKNPGSPRNPSLAPLPLVFTVCSLIFSRPSDGCSTFTVLCQEGNGIWATSQTGVRAHPQFRLLWIHGSAEDMPSVLSMVGQRSSGPLSGTGCIRAKMPT